MSIAQEGRDLINAYVVDPLWFLTVGRKQPTRSTDVRVPATVATLPTGADDSSAHAGPPSAGAAVLDVA
jgi:hypothetical protein